MANFQEWLAGTDPEVTQIQDALNCDRATALQLYLLMRISGDLRDAEGWEDADA